MLHKHRLRNILRDTYILLSLSITKQEVFHQEYVNCEDILWVIPAFQQNITTMSTILCNCQHVRNLFLMPFCIRNVTWTWAPILLISRMMSVSCWNVHISKLYNILYLKPAKWSHSACICSTTHLLIECAFLIKSLLSPIPT